LHERTFFVYNLTTLGSQRDKNQWERPAIIAGPPGLSETSRSHSESVLVARDPLSTSKHGPVLKCMAFAAIVMAIRHRATIDKVRRF
jgi:hypothetical protein